MALFPGKEQACEMSTISALRAWTGAPQAAVKAIEARVGSFDDKTRNLALIPAAVLRAAASAAKVPSGTTPETERPLKPLECSQVGLMWRVAQRVAFTLNGGAWGDYLGTDPMVEPVAVAPVQAPAPAAANTGVVTGQTKVKVALIMDQADDTELSPVDVSTVQGWFQRYVTLVGMHPEEEEEPTAHQLMALNHRCRTAKAAPYVDMAVWVPFGRKASRANRFRTWIPTADGTYISKEVAGPENFLQWLSSWRVFSVACIMLNLTTQAALHCYERTIEKLVRTWPSAWHLIVQGDDKCRAEHLERVRRRMAALPSPPMGWDPAEPWSLVLQAVAGDDKFWDDQVRHPAAAWVAAGARACR